MALEKALQGHQGRVPPLPAPCSLVCATYGNEDLWPSAKLPLGVGLGFERVKERTAPGALGLEKTWQGDPSRASTSLLLHVCNLDHLVYSEDFTQDSSLYQSDLAGAPAHERQFGHKVGRRE